METIAIMWLTLFFLIITFKFLLIFKYTKKKSKLDHLRLYPPPLLRNINYIPEYELYYKTI